MNTKKEVRSSRAHVALCHAIDTLKYLYEEKEPEVRRNLDPEQKSRAMRRISERIPEYAQALVEEHDVTTKKLEEGSVDEAYLENRRTFAENMLRSVTCLEHGLRMLEHCYDDMGLTPMGLERLLDRYEIEVPSGIPNLSTIEELRERVCLAKLRSERALPRTPRVTDDKIRTVVANVCGREKQAATLNLTVRQLQRRLSRMKEAKQGDGGVE